MHIRMRRLFALSRLASSALAWGTLTSSIAFACVAAVSFSTMASAQPSSLSISAFSTTDLTPGDTIHVRALGFTKDTILWLENDRTKLKRKVQLVNLNPRGFDIDVPGDLTPEKYNLIANLGSLYYTAPMKLTFKQGPMINSASLASVVPGGELTISGVGFSERADENKVIFNSYNGLCVPGPPGLTPPYYNGQTGTYNAQVISATSTELTVLAPQDLLQFVSILCPVPCHVSATVRGAAVQGQVDVLVGSLNYPH
jgi:hypothetical protein